MFLVNVMTTGQMRSNLIIFLVLAVVSLVTYYNSLSNPFQFDDEYAVSGNTYIRDIANIKEVFLQPKLMARPGWPSGHYRPLVFASYALNYATGGLNPAGYHLMSLVFHVGSAFLVFLILKALLGGSVIFPAFASALVFTVHPFNSEVVNYITARSSVMCAFFYLLAFYCWIRYRQLAVSRSHPHPIPPPQGGGEKHPIPPPQGGGKKGGATVYYIASLLAFLLAMLTKEIAITLPVILWLYDLYFVPVKGKVQHIKRLAIYLPFVLSVAIPYLVLRAFFWGGVLPRFQRNIMVQLYTEMPVLIKYWRLLVFPFGLSVDHNIRIYETFFALPVIGAYILLMAILVLAIWFYNNKSSEWRIISFFIIWFFIVLLPTTILPLTTILQENRGYIAGVSFAVLAGILLVKVLRPILGHRLFIILFSLLIVVYSIGTVSRNSVWRDDLSLWNDAMAKGSRSIVAYTNLSKAYIVRGEYAKGEELLKETLQIYPYNFYAHYNLSWVYYKTGRYEEALKEAKTALKILPSSYNTYFNMGLIYFAMGNLDMAIKNYTKSLELNPDYVEPHFNMGVIYEESGKLDLAAAHYRQVIKSETLNPGIARGAAIRLRRLEDRDKNKISTW